MDAEAPNPFGFIVLVTYCVPVKIFDPVIANSVLSLLSNRFALAALAANEELTAFCACEADVALAAFNANDADTAFAASEPEITPVVVIAPEELIAISTVEPLTNVIPLLLYCIILVNPDADWFLPMCYVLYKYFYIIYSLMRLLFVLVVFF
jgi:hypothetical protein